MTLDAVVIGAGHAGLGVGAMLQQDGRRFVVLERGRIGETWREQRWDSFRLNTPTWMNLLPRERLNGQPPDAFYGRDELVAALERHASALELPVRTGVVVNAVGRAGGGKGFVVKATTREGQDVTWSSAAVIVAAGVQRVPRVPSFRRHLPDGVLQLHSSQYRNPAQLPAGGVIVVGSGQSGCQIAEDLLADGREVALCASQVGRLPRRYRGADTLEWLAQSRWFDVTVSELDDPAVRVAPQPQISGVGRYGRTVSLQQLARTGARLFGRVTGVEGGALVLDGRLGDYVHFADEKSAKFKREIDAWIARTGATAPEPQDDPADAAAPELWTVRGPDRLDVARSGVSALIWCTGVTGDFGWLDVPVLDRYGMPVHVGGESAEPGLYFAGLPWMRTRKSGIIFGIKDDAAAIAAAVGKYLEQ